MQTFGDFLPKETRNQLANVNLQTGAVLKYHVPFTNPPKEKRVIVVAFDSEKALFALVLINSEINENLSQEAKNLHLELNANGRPYLDHNSHVNCSQIFEQEVEKVKEILAESPGVHLGNLNEVDLKNVTDKIRGAITITRKQKRKYNLL